MVFTNLDEMTLAQMVDEFRLRADQVSELDGRRRALRDRIEQKKAQAAAAARVRNLSEDELAALRAALEQP
jgi:ribosomal protein L10